jgi:hypothetical protein
MKGWESPCTTCPFEWYNFQGKSKDDSRFHMFQSKGDNKDQIIKAFSLLDLPKPSKATSFDSFQSIRNSSKYKREDIKKAFRNQALKWHPDCSKEPNAENKFREILDAYQLLLSIFLA